MVHDPLSPTLKMYETVLRFWIPYSPIKWLKKVIKFLKLSSQYRGWRTRRGWRRYPCMYACVCVGVLMDFETKKRKLILFSVDHTIVVSRLWRLSTPFPWSTSDVGKGEGRLVGRSDVKGRGNVNPHKHSDSRWVPYSYLHYTRWGSRPGIFGEGSVGGLGREFDCWNPGHDFWHHRGPLSSDLGTQWRTSFQ